MLKPLLLPFLLSKIHAAEIFVGIAVLLPTKANRTGASCFNANTPAQAMQAHIWWKLSCESYQDPARKECFLGF